MILIGNFKQYLKDEDSIIDHTFLWDIVSSPKIDLFKDGINLIIMEVENNDRRDNVTLLCPTNTYSDYTFDYNKGSVLILKQILIQICINRLVLNMILLQLD